MHKECAYLKRLKLVSLDYGQRAKERLNMYKGGTFYSFWIRLGSFVWASRGGQERVYRDKAKVSRTHREREESQELNVPVSGRLPPRSERRRRQVGEFDLVSFSFFVAEIKHDVSSSSLLFFSLTRRRRRCAQCLCQRHSPVLSRAILRARRSVPPRVLLVRRDERLLVALSHRLIVTDAATTTTTETGRRRPTASSSN